jgi:hypothetical protein
MDEITEPLFQDMTGTMEPCNFVRGYDSEALGSHVRDYALLHTRYSIDWVVTSIEAVSAGEPNTQPIRGLQMS